MVWGAIGWLVDGGGCGGKENTPGYKISVRLSLYDCMRWVCGCSPTNYTNILKNTMWVLNSNKIKNVRDEYLKSKLDLQTRENVIS